MDFTKHVQICSALLIWIALAEASSLNRPANLSPILRDSTATKRSGDETAIADAFISASTATDNFPGAKYDVDSSAPEVWAGVVALDTVFGRRRPPSRQPLYKSPKGEEVLDGRAEERTRGPPEELPPFSIPSRYPH